MSKYILPFHSRNPHYRLDIDLEGSRFVAILDWNQREGAWYFSLELPDGTQLLDGRKVVVEWPMLYRLSDARRPPGELYFIDTAGGRADPGREDLGGRVTTLYVESRDIQAAAGT